MGNIVYVFIGALALFAAPAFAKQGSVAGSDLTPPAVPSICPQPCVRGTPEHDIWWCGSYKDRTYCSWDTQIGCGWSDTDNKCEPKK